MRVCHDIIYSIFLCHSQLVALSFLPSGLPCCVAVSHISSIPGDLNLEIDNWISKMLPYDTLTKMINANIVSVLSLLMCTSPNVYYAVTIDCLVYQYNLMDSLRPHEGHRPTTHGRRNNHAKRFFFRVHGPLLPHSFLHFGYSLITGSFAHTYFGTYLYYISKTDECRMGVINEGREGI